MQEAHQAWLGPSRNAKSQAVSDLEGVVGFGRWPRLWGGFHDCVRPATPKSSTMAKRSEYPKALMPHPSRIENTGVWRGRHSLICEIHR